MATFLPAIPAVVSPAVFVKGFQNNGAAVTAAQYVSFGHCFQKGQMTEAGMQATFGTNTVVACQVDAKTKYADGSPCHAIVTLQVPPVTQGQILWGQFAPSAAPGGSALSLATAIGSTTASVSLAATTLPDWAASTVYQQNAMIKPSSGNAGGYSFIYPSNVNNTAGTSGTTEPVWPQAEGGMVADGTLAANPAIGTSGWVNIGIPFTGTITQDLVAAVKNSADLWLSGPLAVQGRGLVLVANPGSLSNVTINSALPSAMRIVIDASAFADGTVLLDVTIANDAFAAPISSGSPVFGGTQPYTATITLNGATAFTSAALVHNLSENWSWQVGTLPRVVNSSQDLTLQVVHNPADFIEAQAVIPYDTTIGVGVDGAGNPYVTDAQNNVEAAWFGLPLRTSGSIVNANMPEVGDSWPFDGIGANNNWSMYWLTTQNEYFWGCMLDAARINGYVEWHLWNPNTAAYWTNGDDKLLNAFYWRSPESTIDHAPPVISTESVFQMDFEHYPDLVYIAYLATGRRYYVDELSATALYAQMVMQSGAEGDGTGMVRGQCLLLDKTASARAQGWGFRHTLYAAYAFPDGTKPKQWFRQVLDNNLFWICGLIAFFRSKQGDCFGWLPAIYGARMAVPPWEDDYAYYVVALAAAMGHPLAANIAAWMLNFRAGMLLNGSNSPMSGYPPADAVIYDVMMWSMFQGAETSVGWGTANNPPAQSWFGLEQLIRLGSANLGYDSTASNTANVILQGTLAANGTLTVGSISDGALAVGMTLNPNPDNGAGTNAFATITGGSGSTWTTNYAGSAYTGPMAASNYNAPGDYTYWWTGTGGGGGNADDYANLLYNTLIQAQILGLPTAATALNVLLGLSDTPGTVVPNVTDATIWQDAIQPRLANRTLNDSQVFPLAGGATGNNQAQGLAMMGAMTALPPGTPPPPPPSSWVPASRQHIYARNVR